jgi:hypothetical protein
MARIAFVAVVAVTLGGAALWGNRCDVKPLPRGGSISLCHRWFIPDHMVERDRLGRITGYDLLNGSRFHGVPAGSFKDLFGSGRISEFQLFDRLPGGTVVERTGISTRDDGHVDLALEVQGLAHPLDGRLRALYRIDRERCSEWKQASFSIAGKAIPMLSCEDANARVSINPDEAREIVEALPIIHEREGAFLGRFRQRTHENGHP